MPAAIASQMPVPKREGVPVRNAGGRYAVVVTDHHAARFFLLSQGYLRQVGERSTEVDVSQWKQKDLGHFAAEAIQKTRGPNRDAFAHRIDARYRQICRELAAQLMTLSNGNGQATPVLVGPDRLIRVLQSKLLEPYRKATVLVAKDLGGDSSERIGFELDSILEQHERAQELARVKQLLGARRGAVTGPDEIFARLQKGTIHTLLAANQPDWELHQCVACGLADRSADPVCPACGAERKKVRFWELLPKLVAEHQVKTEIVNGEAARLLLAVGGLGGWLRPRTISSKKKRAPAGRGLAGSRAEGR